MEPSNLLKEMMVKGQSSFDEVLQIKEKPNNREKELVYRFFYGDEQFTHEATPYSYIDDFIDFLKPSKKDIVYDLGSGYGRFIIYCALQTKAKYKGIEIIPERFLSAQETLKKLKLKNACFYRANVCDFDFSDGNIFFLFNPFSIETLAFVGEKLKKIAKNKKIIIATWGGQSNRYFENADWLWKIRESNDIYFKLEYFGNSTNIK